MIRRVSKLMAVPKYQLFVAFDDWKMVLYDVEEDMDTIPTYEPLRTIHGLFEQVRLDTSRTCIWWNDEIDLPSDAVYEFGTELMPPRHG